jgi:hypothetical protein
MSSSKIVRELTNREQYELEKRKLFWLLGLKDCKKNDQILKDFYRKIRFEFDTKSRFGL